MKMTPTTKQIRANAKKTQQKSFRVLFFGGFTSSGIGTAVVSFTSIGFC